MQITKITYELPAILPHGWKSEVAKTLGIHRHTVRNAVNQGETHPMYSKIMAVLKNKYGTPITIKKEEKC